MKTALFCFIVWIRVSFVYSLFVCVVCLKEWHKVNHLQATTRSIVFIQRSLYSFHDVGIANENVIDSACGVWTLVARTDSTPA